MSKISRWVGLHRHTLIAGAGVVCGIAVTLGLTSNKWVALGISVATVAGIYTVPNKTVAKPADG